CDRDGHEAVGRTRPSCDAALRWRGRSPRANRKNRNAGDGHTSITGVLLGSLMGFEPETSCRASDLLQTGLLHMVGHLPREFRSLEQDRAEDQIERCTARCRNAAALMLP